VRLGVLSTHPISYFTPLYRRLSDLVDEVEVLYLRFVPVEGSVAMHDAGFQQEVQWDTDLRSGHAWRSLGLNGAPYHYSKLDVFRIVRGVNQWITRYRPDVVLVPGWSPPYLVATAVLRSRNVRLICRPEASPRRSTGVRGMARDFAAKWFVSQMDSAAVIGSSARDELIRLGMRPQQMFDSPYSIDDRAWALRAVEAQKERTTTRTALGLSEQTVVYVTIGKLQDYKRPLLLAEVFDRLRLKHEDVHLLVVGDGRLRGALEQFIRDRGLDDVVSLLGFVNQSHLPRLLAAADVFVLVSAETWGLVANEAMACGLPLAISYEAGSSRDLVLDNVTGFRLPPEHPDRIVASLEAMLSADLRSSMAMGVTKLRASYSIARAAEGIAEAASSAASTDR
jgi:glycosyltransferase involved in cell wall biosynthesis